MSADAAMPDLPPGLLEEYLAGMRTTLGRLAGLAEQLDASSANREALDTLQRESHKIHGSAGSYGFSEASRLAAGMEATVRDWVARPDQGEVDRGPLTRWFVARLAELFGLPMPRAAAPPPALPPAAGLEVPEVISVEHDAALAELLEYGLRAHGYRFHTYRNGREALRELLVLDVHGTHPLLLLDVGLPELDGYAIFDALQHERPGTYRVVFTTVRGKEQLRGRAAGALDYLVKPTSLRVALEKIKRWVRR